uniref:MATH domain-containing protein n=1 Tax=Globodera rostochiensis TaxID=31243 RepID=A0A914H6X9_GLORO
MLVWRTYSFSSNQLAHRPTWTQKMTFLQVVIISFFNAVCSGIYILMQFIRISEIYIIIGTYTWLFAHGCPPIVYLLLNVRIRKDFANFVRAILRRPSRGHAVAYALNTTAWVNSGTSANEVVQQGLPCGELTSDELVSIFLLYEQPDCVLPESEAVYIRGLPWNILAKNAGFTTQKQSELELCRFGNTAHCFTNGGKRGLHTNDQTTFSRGFTHFMPFSKSKLMDPNNGWYDAKNDTAILEAEVTADKPDGVE